MTAAVALSYALKHGTESVRLLQLSPNQGKGAAIRKGMAAGRGRLLLMCDADGATEVTPFHAPRDPFFSTRAQIVSVALSLWPLRDGRVLRLSIHATPCMGHGIWLMHPSFSCGALL